MLLPLNLYRLLRVAPNTLMTAYIQLWEGGYHRLRNRIAKLEIWRGFSNDTFVLLPVGAQTGIFPAVTKSIILSTGFRRCYG